MPNDPVPNHSRFAKNRERLLNQKLANMFLAEVVRFAQGRNLVSDEHFTADGTLNEAWASLKSFKPKEKAVDVKSTNSTALPGYKLARSRRPVPHNNNKRCGDLTEINVHTTAVRNGCKPEISEPGRYVTLICAN